MGPAVGLDTTAFGSMMCATTLQHCRLDFASVVVAYATIQPRAACAACDIQTVCEVKTDSTLLCCKVGFGQLQVQTGMQLQVDTKTDWQLLSLCQLTCVSDICKAASVAYNVQAEGWMRLQ